MIFWIQQGSLKGSAGPFELVDKPGTEEVILKRAFGNEQIAVTCLLESEYPEEDEEAEEEAAEDETTERAHNESEEEEEEESVSDHVDILRFTVTITKETPMPALEFECSFFRGADEVTIEAVSFLNEDLDKAENDEEPRPYEGPDFKYVLASLFCRLQIKHMSYNAFENIHMPNSLLFKCQLHQHIMNCMHSHISKQGFLTFNFSTVCT